MCILKWSQDVGAQKLVNGTKQADGNNVCSESDYPPDFDIEKLDENVWSMESIVFQPDGHPKQALIDGQIWPPSFEAKLLRSAKQIVACPSDVFVCTYPKCGTTWLQHICSQLMLTVVTVDDPRTPRGAYRQPLSAASPMIERMGAAYCARVPNPRLLKTHLRRAQFPKGPQAKYIFAVRNPKDCLVSYFHHNRNFRIYEWPQGRFDTFFELFIHGQLGFGDYFEHLLSWLPHLNDANVLFLKYEQMLTDLEGAVSRIGHFLGGHAEDVVDSAEKLANIVAASRMDAMKQDQDRFFPASALYAQSFIRKGGTRDWKNYMSREQSDRMDALFREKMAGTVAEGWWREEMRWNDDAEGDDDGEEGDHHPEEDDGEEGDHPEAEGGRKDGLPEMEKVEEDDHPEAEGGRNDGLPEEDDGEEGDHPEAEGGRKDGLPETEEVEEDDYLKTAEDNGKAEDVRKYDHPGTKDGYEDNQKAKDHSKENEPEEDDGQKEQSSYEEEEDGSSGYSSDSSV